MILKKILFLIIAFLFLPPCWAITKILSVQVFLKFRSFPFDFSFLSNDLEYTLLFSGAFLFLLLYRFYKFEFLHTFLHEFTHLLFGLLFWKRIITFKVSKLKGEVVLSGSNLIILLAPYFFPLLTFIILSIGFLLMNFLNHKSIWFATVLLVGFSLMLHIVMTLRTLMVRQSDIKSGGYFFSLVIIYFLSLLLISGIIFLVLTDFTETLSFYKFVFSEIKNLYFLIWKFLFSLDTS